MKRGRNSQRHPDGNRLPRSGILRGRHNFRRLFEQSSVLKTHAIHFRYRLYDDPLEGFFVGFIASKKLGKAVTRNRLKRLLRETYRTKQYLLSDLFETPACGLHGVFMAQRADLTFETANKEMLSLLEKIRGVLLNRASSPTTTGGAFTHHSNSGKTTTGN